MTKHVLLAFAAIVGLSTPAAATPVTFDFIETENRSLCCAPHVLDYPVDLFSITLSSGTETGSASFFPNPPVVTDPDFRFQSNFGGIAPPFDMSGDASSYNISWDAVDGQLMALSLRYETYWSELIGFGLTGGYAVRMGACTYDIDCFVTGYWTDPVPVPEPGSIVLLLGALLSFGLWGRKLTHHAE